MKNYFVKAIIDFNDKVENINRKKGDTFYCDEERYTVLKNYPAVELIEVIEEKIEEVIEEAEIVEEKEIKKSKKSNKRK